eukprot:783281_1
MIWINILSIQYLWNGDDLFTILCNYGIDLISSIQLDDTSTFRQWWLPSDKNTKFRIAPDCASCEQSTDPLLNDNVVYYTDSSLFCFTSYTGADACEENINEYSCNICDADIYGPSNPPPLPNNTSYYHQPHPQEFNYASKLLNINTNDKEILKRNWFKYGLINPSQLQAQNNHTQQAPPYNTHNIHQSKQANIQPMVKYHLTQSDIPTPTFLALPNHIKKSDENKNSYRSFSNMHLSVLTSHTDHFQTCGHIGYTNNHTNTNNNNKSHTHPYLHNHSSSSALLSNEYTNNNDSNMHTIIEVNNDDNKYDENNKFK